MTFTVADHILHRLREWDVDVVFGYPGDGINGLLAAWQRGGTDSTPAFVQTRNEEMAAFAAVGYAKFWRSAPPWCGTRTRGRSSRRAS